jgi:hypothetical protein
MEREVGLGSTCEMAREYILKRGGGSTMFLELKTEQAEIIVCLFFFYQTRFDPFLK